MHNKQKQKGTKYEKLKAISLECGAGGALCLTMAMNVCTLTFSQSKWSFSRTGKQNRIFLNGTRAVGFWGSSLVLHRHLHMEVKTFYHKSKHNRQCHQTLKLTQYTEDKIESKAIA